MLIIVNRHFRCIVCLASKKCQLALGCREVILLSRACGIVCMHSLEQHCRIAIQHLTTSEDRKAEKDVFGG